MTKAELGRLAQRLRKLVESRFVAEPLDGDELPPRGAARTDEVRVIRIREPIRPRARLGDDRALLERQHGLRRAHEREQRLDRLQALRVRQRVRRPFDDRELDALGSRKPCEERRRVERGRPQLEVRRAGERERSRAEKRAAQVGGAAAAARHDSPRRPLERAMPPVDDAGRRQDPQVRRRHRRRGADSGSRRRTSAAGRCGSPIGSPLARRREKARRAAAPLPRSRWSDQSPAPRRWRLPAEWNSADSSALRSHSRRGAILPSSSRTSSDVITGRHPRVRAGAA